MSTATLTVNADIMEMNENQTKQQRLLEHKNKRLARSDVKRDLK